MPYCPGCGVEVESEVRCCPLCRQEVPEIADTPLKQTEPVELRFPVPSNIYWRELRRIKNQIFFALTLIVVGALFCLGFLNTVMDIRIESIHYSVISVACGWFYSMLALGYLPRLTHAVVGAGFITTALTLGLDLVDGTLSWAVSMALPLILVSVVILCIGVQVYRRFKHKNQYVVIPIYVCTGGALLCPAVEVVVDLALGGSIHLSWSVMTLIPLMTIALAMLGLYIKLPERMRSKIRKRLHI